MQFEPEYDSRSESHEDADLEQIFRRDVPAFARVDVDAVLNEADRNERRQGERSEFDVRGKSVVSKFPRQRRLIMLAKAGTLGVCAASLCAALAFGLWGGNSVLGEVQNALEKVKTATYTVTQTEGEMPAQVWKVTLQGDRLCRAELSGGVYFVFDARAKKMMEVDPGKSKVRITENLPVPANYNILSQLANLKASAAKVQPGAPNREIGGKTATGLVAEENGVAYKVWIDPATNLPLEMELERREKLGGAEGERVIKERWTDFRFDEPLDPSLFVLDAPQGFEVEMRKASATSAVEQKQRNLEELQRTKAVEAGK